MKLAYQKKNDQNKDAESGLMKAMKLEKQGLPDEAEEIYEATIRANPHEEKAYDRLMIIYRKRKDAAKELKLIDKAISSFKTWFEKTSPHARSRKISQLSSSISKLTGLAEKKTDMLFTRQPLARWLSRRNILLSKRAKNS